MKSDRLAVWTRCSVSRKCASASGILRNRISQKLDESSEFAPALLRILRPTWTQQWNTLTDSPKTSDIARLCAGCLSQTNVRIVGACWKRNAKNRLNDAVVRFFSSPQNSARVWSAASRHNTETTGMWNVFVQAVSSTKTSGTSRRLVRRTALTKKTPRQTRCLPSGGPPTTTDATQQRRPGVPVPGPPSSPVSSPATRSETRRRSTRRQVASSPRQGDVLLRHVQDRRDDVV